MELKWLEDFLSLAETKSFSQSAEERFVSQSGFSRRIKGLELWVGTSLVDRSTYPTTLTPAGVAFRDTAEEALRLLYESRHELYARQRHSLHEISFYALHSISLTFFPAWWSTLKSELGEVDARLVSDNMHDCVRALTHGNCDFLLCFTHPAIPLLLDSDRYPFRTIGTERLIPVTATDANKAPLFSLPGTKRKPLPYLSHPQDTFLGRTTNHILSRQSRPAHFRRCYENPVAEALKAMALEGQGIAWLTESSVGPELKRGRLARAGDQRWGETLEVKIYRAAETANEPVEKLWSLLK